MTRPPTPETLAHRASPATVAAAAAGNHAVTAVPPTPTSGAGSLVRSLEALGVEVAFGIPGGATSWPDRLIKCTLMPHPGLVG